MPRTLSHIPVVDAAGMLELWRGLGQFGADDQGGVSRVGFGAADRAVCRHVAGWAVEHGLSPSVDPAGNLIVRRSGVRSHRPALLIGSHLDTVVHGGRFDGSYGVVAALEVLRLYAEQTESLRYEPVVVAFANEEGARFPHPFFGSKAMVGALDPTVEFVDRAGVALRGLLREAGGDVDNLAAAVWPTGSIGAYLELHIEQGPVLERRGVAIGVVDAITGRTIVDITVHGQQNHAGTTPMGMRRDALVSASRLVLAIEALSRHRGMCTVSTVGIIEVEPGVTNVVPGCARLTAEIRDGRPERLATAEAAIVAEAHRLADADGVAVDVAVTMRSSPAQTSPALRDAITAAADDLGLSHVVMSSGAGHDAQILASAAPIGMIFVPSRAGISHAPQEHTDDADLVNGANVLLGTTARVLGGWPR